jgi:transcriptional regulator with XRE-family HTH domain
VNIIEEIESIRLSLKWSQERMSSELGISQVNYNQLKSGRTKKMSHETILLAELIISKFNNNAYSDSILSESQIPYSPTKTIEKVPDYDTIIKQKDEIIKQKDETIKQQATLIDKLLETQSTIKLYEPLKEK